MKHVLGGMFLMLVLLRPQVLADIATSVSMAFQPPNQNTPHQTSSNVSYGQNGHDMLLPGEEKIDWIQLRMANAPDQLTQPREPSTSSNNKQYSNVEDRSTSYFPLERPLDNSGVSSKKQAAYERALLEQEILEKHVNYFGDDPVVRKRLNLPPKIKSIDDFDYEGEDNVAVSEFDRLFNSKFKN